MKGFVHTELMLARVAERPRVVMWACLSVVVVSAWAYLAAISPGIETGVLFIDLMKSVCSPDGAPWAASTLVSALVMWSAMSLAMMLPSAAPMISTYMDIAGAAREKRMTVASPGILAGGYITVWLGFAVAATVLQATFQSQGLMAGGEMLTHPVVAGLILIIAGLYQFAPLKHACLTKCRNPMPFFLTNWRDDAHGVFRIGLAQGAFCLGCCWALMVVMFVTGLMNLGWMAVFGVVMILEKTLAEPRFVVYSAGVFLVGAGGWLVSTPLVS